MDAEWLRAWIDGVDEAIARMRRAEGFDGTRRTWTTLGECLLPGAETQKAGREQATLRVVCGRRWEPCGTCKTPKWVGTRCRSCAAGLRERRAG